MNMLPKLIASIAVAAALGLILFSPLYLQSALAHKPLQTSGGNVSNSDFGNALYIPDIKISWASQQALDPKNTALFYTFYANKSQELYFQLSIPQLDNLKDFDPKVAIIGPGVSPAIVSTAKFAQIDQHPLDFPKPIDFTHYSIISLNYNRQSTTPPGSFYEPFTQTSYWTKQEVRASIPSDGQYFIAVYVGSPSDLRGDSKFTLAVGEVEDFKPIDYVTILPLAWINTKLFFKDYLSISVVILIPAIILSAVILRRRILRIYNSIKR